MTDSRRMPVSTRPSPEARPSHTRELAPAHEEPHAPRELGRGFRATLQDAGLWGLVQLRCESRARGVVRLTSPRGVGFLYFSEGQIVHAVHASLQGERAALQILSFKEGTWDTCERPWPQAPTIHTSWQGLLLRAAQLEDEAHRPRPESHEPLASQASHERAQARPSMSPEMNSAYAAVATEGITRVSSPTTLARLRAAKAAAETAAAQVAHAQAHEDHARQGYDRDESDESDDDFDEADEDGEDGYLDETEADDETEELDETDALEDDGSSAAHHASDAYESSAAHDVEVDVDLEEMHGALDATPAARSRTSQAPEGALGPARTARLDPPGMTYRPEDFEHAVRMDASGALISGHGAVEEHIALAAYACRIGDLIGELLGFGELSALEASLKPDGRCVIFRDGTGQTVLIAPRPSVPLDRIRNHLGL